MTKLAQLPLLMVHATGFSQKRRAGLSTAALQPWMRYCNIYIVLFYRAVGGTKLEIYSNFLQIKASLNGMVLHPYGWPLQKQPNHVKNLLHVNVKRTAPDATNAKKQDWDVLNRVNAVVDAQISVKAILPRGGFSVDFEHMVLIFFWKNIKFAIDWYIWPYLENIFFQPMGSAQGLFCLEGVLLLILSIWFLHFSEST